MLIALKLRKENIAEYILYLFQVEDLIRAMKFDSEKIWVNLVQKYKVDEKTRKEIAAWYENLAGMMEKEQIRDKGHLQFLINLLGELNEFHWKLLQSNENRDYGIVFGSAAGLLNEFKLKNKTADNDVQLGIDAVYGYLLLKIKGVEITDETGKAVRAISAWLGHLAAIYKDYENGDLEL